MSKLAKFSYVAIALCFYVSAIPARAEQTPAPTAAHKHASQGAHTAQDPWWKHAVIYEIYPRSFQDSNGDGVGDINGITSRLDYLHDLGIGAIWITPMYPSPLVDFGYDVADYTALDPLYGTLADFDRMMAEAKKRDIRVIMDFVPNHTSDQHSWFKESRSSRTNPKRDWYIWRDGKGSGQPPNNWQSWFGHSAWQFDPTTNQYYYHHFYVEQPDLNWRNPEVRKAMYDAMRFWLDRGVAGFRLDAVSRLFEDPNLHDDPLLPGKNAYGDPNIQHKYTDNLPEIHEVLREMRRVVDAYPGNPVLISEADEPNIKELTKMYGEKKDEVQLPMDFQIADVNKLSAPDFRRLLDEVESNPAHGQPHYFFSNHDQPRTWDRYGDGVHNDQIAKMMAALLLTPRATPLVYYGEEIGMRTTTPARKEDVQDPIGKIGWPEEKGRDGERTPMQWDNSKNSGFSSADHTWLPIPPSAREYNVSVESNDPHSILSFYRRLLALRQSEPALRDGSYVSLDRNDPYVLAYLRKNPGRGESVLVVLNMSEEERTVKLDFTTLGLKGDSAKPLLTAPETGPASAPLTHFKVAPFGVFVGSVH
ncbi:MAG TPA: alpha-glucosidase [Candidatus Dormibacteraeota bacterium]|nr:alpha-glucosidase [Candidatus Dormibacteraeota bacterium]